MSAVKKLRKTAVVCYRVTKAKWEEWVGWLFVGFFLINYFFPIQFIHKLKGIQLQTTPSVTRQLWENYLEVIGCFVISS